jgi:4-hydroxybutyryl-CoA dehydratase/vinylacetyl-CoA-Delta-isomerase
VPYDKRIEVARLIEDLTASYQAGWYSVISLHGGGSPEAMKQEIWRHYPVGNKVDLVERLLERGVLDDETRKITRNRQPGRCCAAGCTVPDAPHMLPLPSSEEPAVASARSTPTSASEPRCLPTGILQR